MSPLAGLPGIVGTHLMLPLADGSLARLALPVRDEADPPESGPSWRADRAPPEARGQVVALGGDRFVVSDGARGLQTLEWPAGNPNWTTLPPGEGPSLEMKGRVTGIALVPGAANRLAISDTETDLSLVDVLPNGALVVRRTWPLGGLVTAGPFLRQTGKVWRIGCIVERSRLVWIDPDIAGPAWSYATPGEDAIVGEPAVAGNLVVVADQSGLYVGVDVKTGKRIGPGYQLRGSIAPAASPMPFQKDRLLAPLSDGTLLLVTTERLREK
jgi:hypothetical protein